MGRHVTAPIRPARARGNARPVSDFTLTRRVQFYETDAAGIVHFSVFFRYMEEAEHAMWRAAGLSIATPDAPIGFPRVATSFEFLRPLRFEDEFDVRLRVTDKTPKTLLLQCDDREGRHDAGARHPDRGVRAHATR